MTLARSPPGTTVGGWSLIPHLNPVGHQSTNWMVLLVLMVATEALTSLGTTSPLYMRQHAMYFPCLGSHLTIMLAGSKAELSPPLFLLRKLNIWGCCSPPPPKPPPPLLLFLFPKNPFPPLRPPR